MFRNFLDDLQCPSCATDLRIKEIFEEQDSDIISGVLSCPHCMTPYEINKGIPRFVPHENYAASFGKQWNLFPQTQLDSTNGTHISEERFFSETQWPRNLQGQKVLEAGCGMGRFTEIALKTEAQCYSLDYSSAVDAARRNLHRPKNHCLVQASIYDIPFPKNFFDKIFCFGVLQHTPDVAASFQNLVSYLKPGGMIAIDVYAAPISWFHPRQILRPFTKRMNPDHLLMRVQKAVPQLLKISNFVASLPAVGPILRHAVPVANYQGRLQLTHHQVSEWAILDTFDWLSPRYEQPQRAKTVKRWFEQNHLQEVSIERNVGIYIARGKKPEDLVS